MKKIYNKPTMILVKMETEHFIAASPGKVDQNQIVNGGTGTNVGGTSSEGGNEDNGNGSVADMASPTTPGQHGMNRRGTPKTKPASMAIESTLNQQRKYLRCHMKPASFFLHVFFHQTSYVGV